MQLSANQKSVSNMPPLVPCTAPFLIVENLMGDFCRGSFVAPYFLTHYGSISVAGKPQPLNSVLAHELAEWTLRTIASLGSKTGIKVPPVFSVDKFSTG